MHDDRIYQDLVNSYYNIYTLNEDVDPIEEAKEDEGLTPGQKQIARQERQGTDELERQSNHLFRRYQKKKPVNEEIVIEYLLDEGFATTVDGAIAIYERMSDEWYAVIMEALKKTDTMNKSEMADQVSTLRKKMADLTKQLDPKNPNPKIVEQIKSTREQIAKFTQGLSSLRDVSGPSQPKRIADKNKEEDEMTPEERKEFRREMAKTRTERSKEKTPEERAETRENIAKRKPSTAGRTPQSTGMNLPDPSGRKTARQQGLERLANAPTRDTPSYYTPSGERRSLNAVGDTEQIRTDATRSERRSGASQSINRPNTRGAAVRGSTRNR